MLNGCASSWGQSESESWTVHLMCFFWQHDMGNVWWCQKIVQDSGVQLNFLALGQQDDDVRCGGVFGGFGNPRCDHMRVIFWQWVPWICWRRGTLGTDSPADHGFRVRIRKFPTKFPGTPGPTYFFEFYVEFYVFFRFCDCKPGHFFKMIHYNNVFSLNPRMTSTRTPTIVSPQ